MINESRQQQHKEVFIFKILGNVQSQHKRFWAHSLLSLAGYLNEMKKFSHRARKKKSNQILADEKT